MPHYALLLLRTIFSEENNSQRNRRNHESTLTVVKNCKKFTSQKYKSKYEILTQFFSSNNMPHYASLNKVIIANKHCFTFHSPNNNTQSNVKDPKICIKCNRKKMTLSINDNRPLC